MQLTLLQRQVDSGTGRASEAVDPGMAQEHVVDCFYLESRHPFVSMCLLDQNIDS